MIQPRSPHLLPRRQTTIPTTASAGARTKPISASAGDSTRPTSSLKSSPTTNKAGTASASTDAPNPTTTAVAPCVTASASSSSHAVAGRLQRTCEASHNPCRLPDLQRRCRPSRAHRTTGSALAFVHRPSFIQLRTRGTPFVHRASVRVGVAERVMQDRPTASRAC